MTSVAGRAKAEAPIAMRLPAGTRDLVDSAAAAEGKTRTEFVLESARLRAIDVLLDHCVFALDPVQSGTLTDSSRIRPGLTKRSRH